MKKILLLLFVTVAIFSCKQKDSTLDIGSEDIDQLLIAYTRGKVKDKDRLLFQFTQKVKIDEANVQDIVTISPKHPFSVRYNAEAHSIEVTPQRPLERGKEYDVYIDLARLTSNTKYQKLHSNIKVHHQYISVVRKGIEIKNNGDKYIVLALNTALEDSVNDLKKIFDAKPQDIELRRDHTNRNDYTVKIRYTGGAQMSWDGSPLQSKENGVINFWGGDLEGFNVLSTYHDKGKNTITVYFSQVLDDKQDAAGFVLQGDKTANFSIKSNTIEIYTGSTTKEFETLYIKEGIQSKSGDKLKKPYEFQVSFKLNEVGLRWSSQGNYIPASGDFKIPFEAVGLKKVRVAVAVFKDERAAQFISWNSLKNNSAAELVRYGDFVYEEVIDLTQNNSAPLTSWQTYGLDLSESFQRNPGYIYRVHLSFDPSHTILECKDKTLQELESKMLNLSWFDREFYDNYYYDDYDEYYHAGNPCRPSFYYGNNGIHKNIHCTQVFPIIKREDNGLVVALKNILTNTKTSGAKVDVLSRQGRVLASATTNSGGIVRIPIEGRKPEAIRVSSDGGISYFSLEEGDINPITEFDVSSGVKEVDNRIFVYTERDIWRPGDTIHLDVMLDRSNYAFPAGLPVKLALYNPKGVHMLSRKQTLVDDRSIYSFHLPVDLKDKTGYWKAIISVGPDNIRKMLRVETIQPNVVDAVFDLKGEKEDWINNASFQGKVNVSYLAGYPMQKGKIKLAANVYPLLYPFKKFKNFKFGTSESEPEKNVNIDEGSTDNEGNRSITSSIDFKGYNAVSRLIVDTQIELPGGGMNTESEIKTISPFSSYVGIENATGKGWRGSFLYGNKPSMEIAHVDSDGNPVKGRSEVKYTLLKAKKDWWYDRSATSRSHSTRSREYYEVVTTGKYTLKDGISTYTHDGQYGSGVFVLRLEDPKSGHTAEHKFHSISVQNYNSGMNPELFQLDIDKPAYDAGESIKLKLPEIKNAMALVSVEKGSRVLDVFWIDLANPEVDITIQDSYYPNVYLNVSIVQNYGQTENDRPMRMYAVQKVLINDRNTVLEPRIAVAEKVEPLQEVEITVSEKQGYPMEYTVAIVDQGLLNITGYRTPDPLNHFSQLFSLFVDTWDVYKHLIQYFNPDFAGIHSIGGDGTAKLLDESADFNRFEPVVYHLGPFKLPANGRNNHAITLPNYIGKLKVMVVACNNTTFGNAEKDVRVASPLMVQSQMPRALNVTDKVTLPVTLFKDEKSINKARIQMTNKDGLLSLTESNKEVPLTDKDQVVTDMMFEVGETSGTTTLTIDASSGRFASHEDTKIFINYPNSYEERTTYYEVAANTEEDINIDAFGYDATKHVTLGVSGLLMPDFMSYYSRLTSYPYGCLEQTTSKAFALLYVRDFVDLPGVGQLMAEDHLDAAINKIYQFQNKDGRFNYWNGGNYYHEWADLYAGHFLIEARAKGADVNKEILKRWINATQKRANQWKLDISNNNVIKQEEEMQAYRMYVLALAGYPVKSAMNRFKSRDLLSSFASAILGAAYWESGMKDIGEDLFYQQLNNLKTYKYNYYTFASNHRNRGFMLAILAKMEKGERVDRFYKQWVRDLNKSKYLNTQEMGFAMLGCHYYYLEEDAKINQEIDFEIVSKLYNKRKKIQDNAVAQFRWEPKQIQDKSTIQNKGKAKLFVTKTERSIDNNLYKESFQNGIQLDVAYKDLNGDQLDPTNLKQGQDLIISIGVNNVDITDFKSMALSLKMPSGWELLNPRVIKTADLPSSPYQYQDYRDDRVYTFFGLNAGKKKRYNFRAKANLKGDFYLPSIQCEHMYMGDVRATTKARRTIVR